jgi:glutathione S-transferase
MILYYKPGACSLASHIALREAGADFDLEKVDTAAGVTETGADFRTNSAMGYVPALTLFDGETLTEGPAILQHIADSAPETGLAPAAGSRDRTTLHARLNFVASELHRAFAPFFASEPPEGEAREKAVATLAKRFDHLERLLEGRDHLVGERFTVADAYAFVVSSWAIPAKIGLDRWPNVRTFVDRIAKRPAVQAAMRAEGLIA